MSEILSFIEGSVGRLRLNRPKANQALNQVMCEAMSFALLAWHDDPAVEAVILDNAESGRVCTRSIERAAVDFVSGTTVSAAGPF